MVKGVNVFADVALGESSTQLMLPTPSIDSPVLLHAYIGDDSSSLFELYLPTLDMSGVVTLNSALMRIAFQDGLPSFAIEASLDIALPSSGEVLTATVNGAVTPDKWYLEGGVKAKSSHDEDNSLSLPLVGDGFLKFNSAQFQLAWTPATKVVGELSLVSNDTVRS